MVHFAFPNVNPGFIGCGRYAACARPAAGYKPPTSLIIAQEIVEKAASLLAPAPFAPEKEVYEKKDTPGEKYAGYSLHLAYLLALINRFRVVKLNLSGGIWCTGKITIPDGTIPLLHEVDQQGFDRKLQAFLSEENSENDTLFLVPAAHIKSHHADLARETATLFTLAEFQAYAKQYRFERKTIVTVRSEELYRLISVIFQLGLNPYKGLEAFDENDAEWFFGREEQIQEIWETYRGFQQCHEDKQSSPRFLAILGASGSGKSSVARAGFLRKLMGEDQQRALIHIFRPGDHPIRRLAEHVASNKVYEFEQDLRQSNDALTRLTRTWDDVPVLILIDQFEEIYAPYVSEYERKQFIKNLLHTASDPRGKGTVVIVLRTDFLSRTRHYPELDAVIARQSEIIPAMDRACLRLAITEPAKRAGYLFDQETLDSLIAATEDNDGALPLLQFALMRIWEGLRSGDPPAETLQRINGVGGALADKADLIYNRLSEDEQRVARRAFLKLIHLDEKNHRYTRRRVKLVDIVAQGENITSIHQVLHRFSQPDARLISLRDEEGQETAEITHEALFTYWERFATWLQEGRDDLRLERRLEHDVQRWDEANRPDEFLWRTLELTALKDFVQRCHLDMTPLQIAFFHASERRHRRVIRLKWGALITLSILTVISVIGGLWALYERQRVERYRRIAENNSIAALHVLATSLFRSHDELGAMLTMVKAGKIVRYAEVPEGLREQIIATFRELVVRVREKNRLIMRSNSQLVLPVFSVAFNDTGTRLASGHADGTIAVRNISDGSLLTTLAGHSAAVLSLAFHPTDTILASGSFDRSITLWETETGRKISTLRGHAGFVYSVAFHPDGNMLASGSDDQTIKLWDVATGKELSTLRGHTGFVYSVAFSPDGTLLASGSDDQTIKLWDVAIGKELSTLRGHTGFVYSVAFSPDRKLLASGSSDRTIKLWRVETGSELITLKEHTDDVRSVQFSPDGSRLASGSGDRTIKLWSVEKGSVITTLQGHADAIYHVAFAPDGRLLTSASGDGTVRVWETGKEVSHTLSLDELLTTGCNWIQGYLTTNPDIPQADRALCDEIL